MNRRIVSLGFWIALAALIVNAVVVVVSFQTITRSNRWVDHTWQVITEVEHLLSVVKDAETGQRGYLLTGRDEYLEPYRAAGAEMGSNLDRLHLLTSDNPAQQARIADLRRIVSEWVGVIEQTITIRRERGLDAALEVVNSGRGKRLTDRARAVVSELEAEEKRLLDDRTAAFQAAVRRAVASFVVTTGAGLLLLLAASSFDRRAALAERRTVEAILQERSWLSTTLTSIGDAVIATDRDGRVKFMNPVAEALTRWTQREAEGRPMGEVFRIVNEETRRPADNPVERVIRGGVIVGLANHALLIARDGAETPVEDSVAPIREGTGDFIGVVMVFRDISAARRHEAELRESEGLFRQLAESIPQLAWMAHPDGHIFWYNRRWYDYTGTTAEQMEGWGWQSIHHPEVLPGVLERWKASIATGEPFDMVFPLRGADGEFRPFLTRVMPLKDERGRVVRWFGTNTDISGERRAEEALRAAKEEAEEANKAKDRFLAVLSHELRTPLNPILLAVTSMLERPTPPEEVRPNLEMIRQNVNLQARLIDDLLDVMRIVQGKMPLHWEVADCHTLIDQAVQICRSEVIGKGLRLELDLAAGHHHINADPARLQQVFWNLTKNAVKFSPEGGTITIRTRNRGDRHHDGDRLVIEVSDNGIGIEPGVLPLIFDPFQQGETAITRQFGGMGLGLAICKGIVEGHGGVLTAESDGKGRGATFRIELRALETTGTLASEQPAGEVTEPDPCAPCRILVVEDEPATLRLMARLLRGLGHEVTTAGTMETAREAVEAGDFDLIVSDIGLPDDSGLELMRQVVALRGPIPAIALTGYGMEDDILRSRAAGFSAHLTKPIDFTKLEAMIRLLTGGGGGGR
ncbi:MAG: CHASE3 domain-containing protein [Planctomycetaceae bacterium]|nr:CHASE3 domain-containing protein [Planctomycetaceae bacterium]